MSFLPVVQRELSELSRRPGVYWARAAVALLAMIAMVWVSLVWAGSGVSSQQGHLLFNTISQGAFLFCLLAGVRVTADALSEEKRQGTLGLLFLTDLKGYDIVLGKLVSRSATAFYCGLALTPMLALSILLGGTDFLSFLFRCICLLNTLFLSLSVGMLVSTFSQRERAAMSATLGLLFAISAGPYIVAGYHAYSLELRDVMLPGFLIYSPVYALMVSGQPPITQFFLEEFWLCIGFTHLCAWLCLVIAGASLASHAHADRPRGKFAAWIHETRQRISYGRAHQRIADRHALLDASAFSWLAGRDRLKRRYPWIFLVLFAALWVFFYYKAPDVMLDLPIVLFVLWFLHIFVKIWAASEVAARFIEDRRSGALELLLTTPLSERDVAMGQLRALLRQFGGPLFLLLAVNVVAALATRQGYAYGFSSENSVALFCAGVIVLVADLGAIHWVAMWRSLHVRGTNRTILQTTAIVVIAPIFLFWILFQAGWLFAIVLRLPPITWANAAWPWAVFCVLYDLLIAFVARAAFYRQFRQRATEAFDARATKEKRPAAARAKPDVPFFKQLPVRVAMSFILLFVVVFAAASIRREVVQSKVRKKLAAVKAKGEPINTVELAMWQGNIPPQENAFSLLAAAQRQHLKRREWNGAYDFGRRGLGWEVDTDTLRSIVASNRLFYATMAQLSTRRAGLREGDIYVPNFGRIGDMPPTLRFRGMLAAREGSAEQLIEAVDTLLHFARVLEGNLSLTALRTQTLGGAMHVVSLAAKDPRIGPEHWREWRGILDQIDTRAELRRQLAIIRVNGLDVFEMPAEALYGRIGRMMSPFANVFAATLEIRKLVGQHDAERLEFLETIDRFQDQAGGAFERNRQSMRFDYRSLGLASREIILPHVMPAFQFIHASAMEAEARSLILKTACDIELFRRARQRLPSAEELKLPPDPFDGAPLRYLREGNGYALYSVGEDQKDDTAAAHESRRTLDILYTVDHLDDRRRK